MQLNNTLRFPLVVNAFWHTAHRNGLSPVCVRICICSADDDEKFLRHTPQRCFDDTGGGGWEGPVDTEGQGLSLENILNGRLKRPVGINLFIDNGTTVARVEFKIGQQWLQIVFLHKHFN